MNASSVATRRAAAFWATNGSTARRPAATRSTKNGSTTSPAARGAICGPAPHFDDRTRRILVIGTMLAIGRWEEFRMHVRAALTVGGFSADDIKEIILQQANYCGVPAGNHAFKEAETVLKELGKLP